MLAYAIDWERTTNGIFNALCLAALTIFLNIVSAAIYGVKWREKLTNLAKSRDLKKHKRLGKIIRNAISYKTQDNIALMFVSGVQVLSLLIACSTLGALLPKPTPEQVGPIAPVVSHVSWGLALLSIPCWLYFGFRVAVDMYTAYSLSLWLERYNRGAFAFVEGEIAASLLGVELYVYDDKSLKGYLYVMEIMSDKYKLPMLPSLKSWLNRERELSGPVVLEKKE